MPDAGDDQAGSAAVARDRWYVLGVLTVVYALNIADRFSISTLIEPIRHELHLSDGGVAFLTGVALALFYVTLGIPLAALADRANRRNILAVAIGVWSLMTALCGLAQNYGHLLLARFGVGIGEAGGTPPSTSILADKFPPSRRPMALTIFALGACLGAWLGSSVAGGVAERSGWRAAFLVLGIPGLVVALIVWLTVREPRRGQLDPPSRLAALRRAGPPSAGLPAVAAQRRGLADSLRFIATRRSAVHLLAGGSVATFWSWGLMWWTPAFLQRSHHMTVGQAGGLLGPMHLIAGTAGTLLASWLMGRPAAADPRYVSRLLAWVAAVTTIPSIAVYWVTSEQAATVLLWIFVPAVYFYIGPILGLLQNVIPAQMRATAVAVLLFTANVANLVIAPQLVGWLSDWFAASFGAGDESLRWALLLLAPTGFWAAWHLWTSGATIREDEASLLQTSAPLPPESAVTGN
ncbi:MAG TPA: MFS transporter [Burkholderiaceae bacterium]|nr:MFS transporter [Burkholderiaceae bacterium]